MSNNELRECQQKNSEKFEGNEELERERRFRKHKAKGTNIVPDILVGPGIDQQPHTHRVTIPSGPNQRRRSTLPVGFATKQSPHTRALTVAT